MWSLWISTLVKNWKSQIFVGRLASYLKASNVVGWLKSLLIETTTSLPTRIPNSFGFSPAQPHNRTLVQQKKNVLGFYLIIDAEMRCRSWRVDLVIVTFFATTFDFQGYTDQETGKEFEGILLHIYTVLSWQIIELDSDNIKNLESSWLSV